MSMNSGMNDYEPMTPEGSQDESCDGCPGAPKRNSRPLRVVIGASRARRNLFTIFEEIFFGEPKSSA
jgi:hypothetical protein